MTLKHQLEVVSIKGNAEQIKSKRFDRRNRIGAFGKGKYFYLYTCHNMG